MGRQPAKSPVVIDLVDSDSDIEIIHHTIMVLDDETPPEPTTQQVCTPTLLSARWVLMAVKRGLSLHSPLPAVKVEGIPLPIVKVEVPPCPTGTGNHQKAEHGPLYGPGATGIDETDSGAVSEVDDQYAHVKVCDGFKCILALTNYFQVLDEMPWLSESDIKDIPPVNIPNPLPSPSTLIVFACQTRSHLYHMAIHHKVTKVCQYSLMPSPTNASILDTGYTKVQHK